MTLVSVVAARKDSKYLAKFLHDYAETATAPLVCVYNANDTWNLSLISDFSKRPNFYFIAEDKGWGRNGLAKYYDMALPKFHELGGSWLVYFCEDHSLIVHSWDDVITNCLTDINPDEPALAIPGWSNTGQVSHIFSRGYLKALGVTARHGNLDSYTNFVADGVPGLKIRQLPRLFRDFTADIPQMLDDSYTRTALSAEGVALPGSPQFNDIETQSRIRQDQALLTTAIREYKTR